MLSTQIPTLTVAEEKIKGMDSRVAAHNAEAKVIEDKIFDINQPPIRKYTFTRIDAIVN